MPSSAGKKNVVVGAGEVADRVATGVQGQVYMFVDDTGQHSRLAQFFQFGPGPLRPALVFFVNDPATPEIYTLALHDALPISPQGSGSTRSTPAWRGARAGRSAFTECGAQPRARAALRIRGDQHRVGPRARPHSQEHPRLGRGRGGSPPGCRRPTAKAHGGPSAHWPTAEARHPRDEGGERHRDCNDRLILNPPERVMHWWAHPRSERQRPRLDPHHLGGGFLAWPSSRST